MFKKVRNKQLPIGAAMGIGIGVSMLLSVGVIALSALLLEKEKIQINAIAVIIAISQFVSSFLGSVLACKIAKQKMLITAAGTALGYLAALLTLTVFLFSGEYHGVLLGLLMTALGGAGAILVGLRKEKGRIRKHKIPAYR